MKTVEKTREVTQFLLSLDEIRLCQEIGRLVKEIPDEKKRFQQIGRLWEAYIPAHSKERDWARKAKEHIALNHLLWVQTLQAQDRNAEELFAMIQNYIKQTDISPLPLLTLRIYAREFEDYLKQINYSDPTGVIRSLYFGNIRWIYKGYIYEVTGKYTVAQTQLLIQEAFDRERKYWEKLEQKYGRGEELSRDVRPRIPESIRMEVWRRDSGKCARCGNRENLEYDHIVPISRGGSNTSRNIELLCEKCNRQKGANIE